MTASEKNLYDFYGSIGSTTSVSKVLDFRFSMITEIFSGWPRIIYNLTNIHDLTDAFTGIGDISKAGFPIAVINRNLANVEATDYMRKISVFPVEMWELMEIQQPIFPEYVLAPDSEVQKINSSEELKEFADLVNLHLMGTLKINDSLIYELSAIDGFDFFGLYQKGELVSTLLTYSAYGISGLYFIATQPEHRGKGYAGNLIRYVINFLFNQGKEKVVLQSDRKAVPLYLRAGFIPVGQMVVLRKI